MALTKKQRMGLGLAAGAALLLVLDYCYYSHWWFQRQAAKAAQEAKELPHRQILAQLEDLKLHGTSLPPCPVVFPLLDSKGHVTPLGSYLSYLGMVQASYLPQAALSLPNLDQAFRDFDLRNPRRATSNNYLIQLPFRLQTKDFAEGTWKKTFSGWKLHLRFWGTKPEKTYDQIFTKGDLHSAPSWIAASLQDYLGFKPSVDQAVFLRRPVFTQDADLLRAANLQVYFNHGGEAFVTHWQDFLAQNPDQPNLVCDWMNIQDQREGRFHPEMMEALLKKQPLSSLASKQLAEEYFAAGRYADALPLFFALLKSNDNNGSLYAWAGVCLENLGEWDASVELTRTWTRKYPENPESWMTLALRLTQTTPSAPPTDPATPIPTPPTVLEALQAAQKACDLAPQDARAWINLMQVQGAAHEPQTILETSFQKAVSLDPSSDKPYEDYLSTLNAVGLVDAQAAWDFVKQNAAQHPTLWIRQADETLKGTTADQTLTNLKNSGEEAALDQAYRAALTLHPTDLDLWKDYLNWTHLTNTTAQTLAFAATLTSGNPELNSLVPTLTLIAAAGQTDTQAVSQTAEAYQTLLALDDQDWSRWNAYAKFCVANSMKDEARKALTVIGDNWDASIWPRSDFDKARVDLGLDPIPPAPNNTMAPVSQTATPTAQP